MQKAKALVGADLNSIPTPKPWIVTETENCDVPDERLAKRFGNLLEMISHGVGDSIPAACQDWANTKAAYRFLSNDRITDAIIMKGHLASHA